jgi:chemotaxis protein histidine kinase CheA
MDSQTEIERLVKDTPVFNEILQLLHSFDLEVSILIDTKLTAIAEKSFESVLKTVFLLKQKIASKGLKKLENLLNYIENFLEIHCSDHNNIAPHHILTLLDASNLIFKIIALLRDNLNIDGYQTYIEVFIQKLNQDLQAVDTETSDFKPGLEKSPKEPFYDLEMLDLFSSESFELLEQAEETLLMAEKFHQQPECNEHLKTCFRHFHTLKGNSNIMGITPFEQLMHAAESALEEKLDATEFQSVELYQLLLKAIDTFRFGLEKLINNDDINTKDFRLVLVELDQFKSSVFDESTGDIPNSTTTASKGISLIMPETSAKNSDFIKADNYRSLDAMQTITATSNKDIRVGLDKLDHLVNLTAELVTVANEIYHYFEFKNNQHEDSTRARDQLQQISNDIQEVTMSTRMIPVENMFRRMSRPVRDISLSLGKRINLSFKGEDTEIDKTMAELITDPILHIIRNAIDHGLETPDDRQTAGKAPLGNIMLEARHMGNEVWIIVQDDGKGLDRDKIKIEAQKKGLLESSGNHSDRAIWQTILESGLSTAKEISELSGRGVGMGVVKRNLEKLSGTIDINSQKGIGTTITLRLPLTLAIIETLLVKIDDDYFSIPLATVKGCAELTRKDIEQANGRHLIKIHGELIPYIYLREKFDIKGTPPDVEQIVIIEQNGYQIGLVVDSALDKHQTIIKSLSKVYEKVDQFSGATILGDGTLALIIDVNKLIDKVISNENKIRL